MTDQPKKSEQPKRDEGRQYVRKDTEGNNKYQRGGRRGGENSRERRGNNHKYSRSTRYDRKTRDSKHQANKKLEPQTPAWSPKPSPPGSWAGIVAAAAKKLEAAEAEAEEEEAEAARAEEDDNFF